MKNLTKKTILLAAGAVLVVAYPAQAQTAAEVGASAEIGASLDSSTSVPAGVVNKALRDARAVSGKAAKDAEEANGGAADSVGIKKNIAQQKVSATGTAAAQFETKAKARGNQEIDRRIKGLTELGVKVQGMKHITEAQKTSISTVINNQISMLTSLRAKIDAETDAVSLKADIKSITDSYRIYALILPQIQILTAADRIDTLADALGQVSVKLNAHATSSASTAATSTSALLSDITAKIADAKVQANAAVTIVAALAPDNGDKAKMTANTTALKDARAKIKAGNQDIQAARKDIDGLVKSLKGTNVNAKVKASAATTVKTRTQE